MGEGERGNNGRKVSGGGNNGEGEWGRERERQLSQMCEPKQGNAPTGMVARRKGGDVMMMSLF